MIDAAGQSPTSDRKEVVILYPAYAILPARVERLVKPLLSVQGVEYTATDDGHLQPTPLTISYCSKTQSGSLLIPAGFVPHVADYLNARGYSIRIDKKHDYWPKEVDPQLCAVQIAYALNERLASAVAVQPRRQFIYEYDDDRLEILEILLRLFGDMGVLIAVKNRETCRRLLKQLRKRTDRHIAENVDGAFSHRPATLLGTYSDAWQISQDNDFQVIVLADTETAVQLAGRDDSYSFWSLDNMRVFGLVSDAGRLDLRQRFALEARFGPPCVDWRGPRYLPTVTVHRVGPFTYPDDQVHDALQRKRQYIWHNKCRNVEIARLAQACLAGDRAVLREYTYHTEVINQSGSDNDENSIYSDDTVNDMPSSSPNTVILVESPEHARALKKMLRDWPVLNSVDNAGARAQQADTPLMPQQAIVTWTRACRDGLAADVLIRADGSAAGHHDAFGPHIALNNRPMTIFDVHDDFDDEAKQNTARRNHEYKAREYKTEAEAIPAATKIAGNQRPVPNRHR